MVKRIAVVTGGMGGIGQAICRELHKQGNQVVATYSRPQDQAIQWQTEQHQQGFAFEIVNLNVTSFEACSNAIEKIEDEIGPISILINNAGITRDHSCCKMTQEDWDAVISTNLNGVFYVTRAAIKYMKERNYGRIINISSINGQKGQFGQVNYAAAKAGIHGFTKSLALEVAKHHITVNTVSPGYVNTEMTSHLPEEIKAKIIAEIPIGRFANPEEIAQVVAFLAHENISYMTGANLNINGGHYML